MGGGCGGECMGGGWWVVGVEVSVWVVGGGWWGWRCVWGGGGQGKYSLVLSLPCVEFIFSFSETT